MYGIFTYIWVIYGVNVGKYSIHGSYGIQNAGSKKKVLQIDHQETIQKQGDSSYLSDTHGIGFTPGMSKQPGTCW